MGTNARRDDPITSIWADEDGGIRRERNIARAARQVDIHLIFTHPEIIAILSPNIDGEPRKRCNDLKRAGYIVETDYVKRNQASKPPTNRPVRLWMKSPELMTPTEQERCRQLTEEGLASGLWWPVPPRRKRRTQAPGDDFAWAVDWANKFRPLGVMVKPAGFFDM